jgi:hypothetical protein
MNELMGKGPSSDSNHVSMAMKSIHSCRSGEETRQVMYIAEKEIHDHYLRHEPNNMRIAGHEGIEHHP